MSVFEGKTLLITGGTGSFGNAVLNRFLRTDIGEIRIFSRDEKIARYLIEQGCDLNSSPVLEGYDSVREFAKWENALDFLEWVERKK